MRVKKASLVAILNIFEHKVETNDNRYGDCIEKRGLRPRKGCGWAQLFKIKVKAITPENTFQYGSASKSS